jgi:hypothetical protein
MCPQIHTNSTLRRIFRIDAPASSLNVTIPSEESVDQQVEKMLSDAIAVNRTKAPKTDLRELIRAGFVREGETLYLVDYQGKRVPNISATVSGPMLEYHGTLSSMSSLAETLLKDIGFRSNSVRGPSHWVNANGQSMQTVWAQLLESRTKA